MKSASSGPPDDPLRRIEAEGRLAFDMFVTFRINQLSMAFERQWTRYMREHVGLSLGEWRVVATLASGGPLGFARVVDATGMNKALCSRCVSNLQAQGLVQASPTPGDSRSITLVLTPQAQRLVRKLQPIVLRRQRHFLQALTEHERRVLYASLEKLQRAAASWDKEDGPEP